MATQSTMEERFGKCPCATAQSLISGKWAVLILLYLEDGIIRFAAERARFCTGNTIMMKEN